MSCMLKALDTSGFGGLLEEFDEITRAALNGIVGTPVTNLQWERFKRGLLASG